MALEAGAGTLRVAANGGFLKRDFSYGDRYDPKRGNTDGPAAWPSGFSGTGAVSTNTFTSPPASAISQRASRLRRFLTVSW